MKFTVVQTNALTVCIALTAIVILLAVLGKTTEAAVLAGQLAIVARLFVQQSNGDEED